MKNTYLVLCEIEVEASSIQEAKQEGIESIKELIEVGELYVEAKPLS
ncbi:hypothetical protein MOB49_17670 [Bacillus haynesii]|jgi:hypothetical protein|nr:MULTISPECIES: hypothetical protein [Bacillus]MCY7968874.1 hypothetical protein [Bacillus haynesii]MCY8102365.1 hypothetical protein [Bacillus haynesii]MCY8665210.1 hypothetical protein [Bacillus haynesii]MEC1343784.1 hypothetical protein [Bacillus haynesii]